MLGFSGRVNVCLWDSLDLYLAHIRDLIARLSASNPHINSAAKRGTGEGNACFPSIPFFFVRVCNRFREFRVMSAGEKQEMEKPADIPQQESVLQTFCEGEARFTLPLRSCSPISRINTPNFSTLPFENHYFDSKITVCQAKTPLCQHQKIIPQTKNTPNPTDLARKTPILYKGLPRRLKKNDTPGKTTYLRM